MTNTEVEYDVGELVKIAKRATAPKCDWCHDQVPDHYLFFVPGRQPNPVMVCSVCLDLLASEYPEQGFDGH